MIFGGVKCALSGAAGVPPNLLFPLAPSRLKHELPLRLRVERSKNGASYFPAQIGGFMNFNQRRDAKRSPSEWPTGSAGRKIVGADLWA